MPARVKSLFTDLAYLGPPNIIRAFTNCKIETKVNIIVMSCSNCYPPWVALQMKEGAVGDRLWVAYSWKGKKIGFPKSLWVS